MPPEYIPRYVCCGVEMTRSEYNLDTHELTAHCELCSRSFIVTVESFGPDALGQQVAHMFRLRDLIH